MKTAKDRFYLPMTTINYNENLWLVMTSLDELVINLKQQMEILIQLKFSNDQFVLKNV